MRAVSTAFRSVSLLAFSFLAGCAANGAIVQTKDPFTGPGQSFARYLDSGHYTAVGMAQGGGKYSLQVLVVERGQANLVGKPGDKGDFKLGDKTVTLPASAESRPVTNATQYEVFTQWMVFYDLTQEQVLEFAKAPLAAVKVSLGDHFYQLELSPADAQVVRENAAVLASAK